MRYSTDDLPEDSDDWLAYEASLEELAEQQLDKEKEKYGESSEFGVKWFRI